MILATPGGNRDVRLFEAAGFIPRPGSADAIWSGPNKIRELSIGAVAACVRLISEEIAGFVMRTYTGDGQMNREPVYDDPTAALFQDPTGGDGYSSFDLWSDTVATGELNEYALLWKTIASRPRRRVVELYPVDPDYARITMRGGVRTVTARVEGKIQDITANVVCIRAWSPGANATGVSTVDMHRAPLKVAGSYDLYRGRYFDNDGTPGIVIEVPGSPDKQKRQDMLDGWWKRHGGVMNVGKPGIAWGGMQVKQLSPNLRDSQAHELSDAIVRDVGRIFRFVPLELLHGEIKGTPRSAEATSDMFVRFTCLPRLRRIERALAQDRDLYPDRTRYPRFDTSELLRADFATAAVVAHNLVQVGIATPNEGRAMSGLPPSNDPDADKLLKIPVGGGEPKQLPQPNVQGDGEEQQVSRRDVVFIPMNGGSNGHHPERELVAAEFVRGVDRLAAAAERIAAKPPGDVTVEAPITVNPSPAPNVDVHVPAAAAPVVKVVAAKPSPPRALRVRRADGSETIIEPVEEGDAR